MIKSKFLPISVVTIILYYSTGALAQQNNKGIRFEDGLSWSQIKEKAIKEKKYILVDFYATWCGPCKLMDKETYASDKVGGLVNERFISIKVQEDRTDSDNVFIKKWYSDADSLVKEFHIRQFPTIVFFSPDGKLIEQSVGFKDETAFADLLNRVITLKIGYQEMVERYKKGTLPIEEFAKLALKSVDMGDITLAKSIAESYKENYLYQLPDSALLTKEHLTFIVAFPSLITSGDHIFKFFLEEPKRIDELVRPGYSGEIVKYVISKEEVDDKLFSGNRPTTTNPDWKKLRATIQAKYGYEYANSITNIASQLRFFRKANSWRNYIRLINDAMRIYPPSVSGYKFANTTMVGVMFQRDDWNLNSAAWAVFLYCNDNSLLRKVLKWCDLSIAIASSDNGIDPVDQYYDTKANLQYKLGKVKEALKTEYNAYEIAKRNREKLGGTGGGESYLETIAQMKAGLPTWPDATAPKNK